MTEPLTGSTGFIDDIARWREVAAGRAPSYHRLFHELTSLLTERSPDAVAIATGFDEAWASRTFRIFYDRPLLVLAALRRDALVEGQLHPLWSAIGASEADPSGITRSALLAALSRETVWHSLRTRFVQTNETSRAVAWSWPAHLVGCSDGRRPLILVEAGTAAGLNLVADRLPSPWTDASGSPLPTVRSPDAIIRLGIDAYPVDACDDRDASWLRACVWAGERERIERLEAAIAAFRSSPAIVEKGDITQVPSKLHTLSAEHSGRALVLAFQTLVRDYLDERTNDSYESGMRAWIQAARPGSALWLELEIDHADPEKRVPILAHVRGPTGVIEIVLGTTGYHPTTVRVDSRSVEQLGELIR